MRTLKNTLSVLALFVAIIGFSQTKSEVSFVVQGKVVSEETGKAIGNIHVYILEGEEEALTNSAGEFKIQSWQKTPFRLTVKSYNNYRETSIVITDPSKKQVIRLKSK